MAIFNSYVKFPEGTHPEYLQLRRFHYGSGTNPGRTSSKQRSATPRRQLRHAKRGCSLILSIVGKPSVLQGRTVFGKIRVNSCGIAFLVGKSIRFRLIETSDYQMILDDAKVRQSQHNITQLKTSKNPWVQRLAVVTKHLARCSYTWGKMDRSVGSFRSGCHPGSQWGNDWTYRYLKREKHREFRTGFCRGLSGQTKRNVV